jgi:hypothetical protein
MKKLPSSEISHVSPGTFFSTTIVTLAFLLASAPVGLTEPDSSPTPPPTPPPQITLNVYWSGNASITTDNCNDPGGLCQAAPACNNGSGPNPDNIQASVTLCETRVLAGILGDDIPSTGILRVRGTGTGFQFGKTYVSLLYLNGNTATCSRFPPGVAPTLQNLAQADSDFASMHLGFWVVSTDGSATLTVDKQATVTGLDNYKTVSVREMQSPNAACYDCGNDPAPQLNALRACGALTVSRVASLCPLP